MTRDCPKTGEKLYCDWPSCDECDIPSTPENIKASCGNIVYAKDRFICPYFSRPEEWKKHNGKYGPCGVNLQLGTNCCMEVI